MPEKQNTTRCTKCGKIIDPCYKCHDCDEEKQNREKEMCPKCGGIERCFCEQNSDVELFTIIAKGLEGRSLVGGKKKEEAALDIVDTLIKSGYTRLKDIHLCRCRNDEEGAMTVKRLNDDFHQCPRCGGLLPLNKRKLSREKIKECIDKFWIEWEAESNQLYSGDLSTAIVETDLWE